MDAPQWLDELSFTAGPPWHTMGTRAVTTPRQSAQGSTRANVLAAARADCVGGPDDRVRALEQRAIAEDVDLCVLTSRAEGWILEAGVVCFPSMWRVADKIGLPITAVHGPVPAYASELAGRVDRLLDRLDRPVWRRNWFVHDNPTLHLPSPPPPRANPRIPDDLWLRSEYQTLTRFSPTEIEFAIHTDHTPLSVLVQRPDIGSAMGDAIRAWSPELLAYRSAQHWRNGVLDWLDSLRPWPA